MDLRKLLDEFIEEQDYVVNTAAGHRYSVTTELRKFVWFVEKKQEQPPTLGVSVSDGVGTKSRFG